MIGRRLRVSANPKGGAPDPAMLANLLHDTSTPALIVLAEQYGVPGGLRKSHEALVEHLLRDLLPEAQARLMGELIAARYGALSVEELLSQALATAVRREPRATAPVLEAVSADEAALTEDGPPRWGFVIRDHPVTVDVAARRLTCNCRHFEFAARRGMLCKHLVMAFRLMPEEAAREALIDLLAVEQYGGPQTPRWQLQPP
jgi:hypothetical protein